MPDKKADPENAPTTEVASIVVYSPDGKIKETHTHANARDLMRNMGWTKEDPTVAPVDAAKAEAEAKEADEAKAKVAEAQKAADEAKADQPKLSIPTRTGKRK